MSAAPPRTIPAPRLDLRHPEPPFWVAEVLGEDAKEGARGDVANSFVTLTESRDYAFVRLTLPGADDLDDEPFRDAARHAYVVLGETLEERGLLPLRIWNYIPGIRRPVPGGSSRYELFNIGRYQGFEERFADRDLSHHFCAASGVGHRGSDLVLHTLASHTGATPVENPRQRPAYRYSRRYGPVPPSFARAARLAGPLLATDTAPPALVSGTASIVGEETRHPGDITRQVDETIQNLVHLSRALAGESECEEELALGGSEARDALARYTDLRAYVVRDDDVAEVLATLERSMPGLRRLELAVADLCRPGLRVEIEGIARLDP